MLPGRVCLRGLWRNTRAKHYSEGSGMLPWNAPSPAPHSGSQQLLPQPPCRSQAPGSPEPVGSPPCPLTQSLGKRAQLPKLTATHHPASPDPTFRQRTAEVFQLLPGHPNSFLFLHPLPQPSSSETQNSSSCRSPLLPGSPPGLDEPVATMGEESE